MARAGERSENPLSVRSGGRGAFAARGLERNGRPRPSRAFEEVALFDPRAHRDRAPGMAGSGPRRSPPRQKIDPPPRGALSAIRVVCGIAVCSPPPAFCPCVPAQRAACLPRWEPWSRATPRFLLWRSPEPSYLRGPGACGSGAGVEISLRLPVLALLAQHQPSPVFRLLLRRLKVDELISPHSSHHTPTSLRRFPEPFGVLRIFTTLGAYPLPFHQARTCSVARVPQPCVLSCSRAMRGAYHAPIARPARPPHGVTREGLILFQGERSLRRASPRSPLPSNRR